MTDETKLAIAAFTAGLVTAAAIVIPLAMQKGQDLQARGQLLSASLTSQGTALQTLLTSDGQAMAARLQDYAQQAAMDHLGQDYGLTPERIQGLQRLFARFGVT